LCESFRASFPLLFCAFIFFAPPIAFAQSQSSESFNTALVRIGQIEEQLQRLEKTQAEISTTNERIIKDLDEIRYRIHRRPGKKRQS